LVFVHGFANAFEAAISRAAFNREWFASSPVAGADMTVLAFTWPSAGATIAVPPHFLSGAYRADQARASSSGAHLAWFLDEVKSLRDEAKRQNPRRRVVLLAHSMGNFALAAGVQAWFLSRGTTANLRLRGARGSRRDRQVVRTARRRAAQPVARSRGRKSRSTTVCAMWRSI